MKTAERIKKGDNFIVRHPFFGSLYLHEVEVKGDFIEGYVYDFNTPTGDGCLKEAMNFPLSCVYFTK